MAKHRILLTVVLVLAAAVRVYVEQSTGFQFDDAWITYRYAENLAAGNGFVYNTGEYVEGSTAPLLVLLLSLFRWLGISIPTASLALSIPASMALLYLVWRICEPRIGQFGASIAVVVLGFSPSLVIASVSGMETTLFIALLLLASVAYRDDRPLLLGSAIAALALTRIDGLVFLPALVATEFWSWYRDRGGANRSIRIALLCRSIGTAALLLLPWIVFALCYFGDVVPNSIWAKLALYRQAGMDVTARSMIIEAMLTLGNQSQPMLEVPVVLAALLWTLIRARREAVLALWFLAYAAFFLSGPVHMHPWYYTPFQAIAAILVVLCLGEWWHLVPWHLNLQKPWRAAGVAFALMAMVLGSMQSSARAATYQAFYNSAHINLANYIAAQSRAEDTVYAWDVGYIGAISSRRVLDFVGIVSPEVIPYNHRENYVGVLKTWRPQWAVIGYYGHAYRRILDDPWFRSSYVLVHRNTPIVSTGWSIDDPRRDTTYTWEYGIYRLID
jgi:hypothetical protein